MGFLLGILEWIWEFLRALWDVPVSLWEDDKTLFFLGLAVLGDLIRSVVFIADFFGKGGGACS